MNNTSASRPDEGRASTRSAQPGAAQSGAEYGEAGDPGDPGAAPAARSASATYSSQVPARGGSQGQVSGQGGREAAASQQAMLPPVDIFEDEGGVTLLADLPGVSREGLQVRVDGDTLLIEGRAEVPEVGEMDLIHGELQHPAYRRSFTLSRDLDPQRIEAQLNQGVLRLRLHKAEQAKPRRIEVQGG